MSTQMKGRIGLIVMALLWGSSFAMNQVAMQAYSPFQLIAARYLIAAVLLIIIFRKRLVASNKVIWIKGSIMGIILYGAYALQTAALSYTTATNNAFITAFNVVLVPLIGSVFLNKKISSFEYLGVTVAMVGITVMSVTEQLGNINLGDLLTLIGAVFFALHIIFTDKYAKEEDVMGLNTIQMIVAALLASIVALVENKTWDFTSTQANWTIIYLAVFCTLIAFLLQTYSQQYTTETETVLIMSTESIFALIFSIVVVNEIPTLRTLIGAALILTGVLIVELMPKRRLKKDKKMV